MTYKEKYENLMARLLKAKDDDDVNDERYCCVIDTIIEQAKEDEQSSAEAPASEDLDLGCDVIWRNQEEPASDDMEQASRDYADNHYADFAGSEEDEENYWCSRFGFKAGADWQKQQMMKEALDGEICIPNAYSTLEEKGCLIARAKVPVGGRFKFGDKVKVIIVKED